MTIEKINEPEEKDSEEKEPEERKFIAEERVKEIMLKENKDLSCWDITRQLNQSFQWTSVILNRLISKEVIETEYIKLDKYRGYHVYRLKKKPI